MLFNFMESMIPADSILVDFGCGRGRVLLVGLEFGFREVRGVEFAHELCEIARYNCASYKAIAGHTAEVRIVECDATKYCVNTDENVFFMYNPFDETIVDAVVSNIAASLQKRDREIWIIYNNPIHGHLIEQRAEFTNPREYNIWGHTFKVYSNNQTLRPGQ